MQYVSYLNSLIKNIIQKKENTVCFGQNITTGSCLGGLTRGINEQNKNLILNTTNNEYSMSGVGFGLMVEGVNAIYFHKQQDFTLLGMDHFVHTWNSLSINKFKSSYTIFSIVVDNGFEGPQSCINMLRDISSLSNISGYTISNIDDAKFVINNHLINPGVRFISVSQKLFKNEIIYSNKKPMLLDKKNCLYKYFNGEDVTVLCTNFAFQNGLNLCDYFRKRGLKPSLVNASCVMPTNWDQVLKLTNQSKKLVIIDDSKSNHKELYNLSYNVIKNTPECKVSLNIRSRNNNDNIPNDDIYKINFNDIFKEITK